MRNQQKRLASALLIALIGGVVARANADDEAEKCAAKVTEIDAAIEAARKEGSMRKISTLKDLRAEAARCANRGKTE